MGLIGKIIDSVLGLAFFLGTIGALKGATIFFAEEFAKQQKVGLISLTKLNYQMMGREKFCSSIHWTDKRCRSKSKSK